MFIVKNHDKKDQFQSNFNYLCVKKEHSMEVKINLAYEQVLEIIKQLPNNQIQKLLADAKHILENEKIVDGLVHRNISVFNHLVEEGSIRITLKNDS